MDRVVGTDVRVRVRGPEHPDQTQRPQAEHHRPEPSDVDRTPVHPPHRVGAERDREVEHRLDAERPRDVEQVHAFAGDLVLDQRQMHEVLPPMDRYAAEHEHVHRKERDPVGGQDSNRPPDEVGRRRRERGAVDQRGEERTWHQVPAEAEEQPYPRREVPDREHVGRGVKPRPDRTSPEQVGVRPQDHQRRDRPHHVEVR